MGGARGEKPIEFKMELVQKGQYLHVCVTHDVSMDFSDHLSKFSGQLISSLSIDA